MKIKATGELKLNDSPDSGLVQNMDPQSGPPTGPPFGPLLDPLVDPHLEPLFFPENMGS